jgi:hypothetical protein
MKNLNELTPFSAREPMSAFVCNVHVTTQENCMGPHVVSFIHTQQMPLAHSDYRGCRCNDSMYSS